MKREHWVEAIYAGKHVEGLMVSDQGRMRRGNGEPGFGTPNIDRERGYLRSMQVCIVDPAYRHRHRAVNLHRVIWESFNPGEPWVDGNQIDHIDRNVSNGSLGNLRQVTRRQNMRNRNLAPAGSRRNRYGESVRTPRTSEWRYRECLRCGVRRLRDLPEESRRQYRRMYSRELRAFHREHAA